MIKGPITFDRMARWVLIAAAVVATIFILSYLSNVLLPFFAALVFAYLLYPLVKFIQYRMKVKIRVLSVVLAMIVGLSIFAGILYLIIPPMIEEFSRFTTLATRYLHHVTKINNFPETAKVWLEQNSPQIEEFLTSCGQKYITDSTNLEDGATRNKVRHHIIPELQQLNGKALENIQRMTERMAAVEELLDAYKAQTIVRKENGIVIRKLDVLNDYLLYELLADYGFNSAQASQICDSMRADSVGSVFSSADYDLLVDRECLLVEPHLEPMKPFVIPETGTYILDEKHKIRVESGAFEVSKDPLVATLDASKVHFPLTVRRAEEGDWMVPFGMSGRKLLSDMMTDLKKSIFDKRKQIVVTDNQGIIIWSVGLRVSQNVAILSNDLLVPVLRLSFS